MFRLLDRYLLGQFLMALAVFTVAFIGLYVVIDIFAHIEDFLRVRPSALSALSFIMEYYALRLPLFLVRLLPVVTVFAAMHTVTRMRRSNEFLPMVASGISLRRVFLPIFLTGGLVGVIGLGLDEWVLPSIGDLLISSQTTLDRGEKKLNILATDSFGRDFYMEAYDRNVDEMREVMTTRFDRNHAQIEKIFAHSARWMGGERGGWRLNGTPRPDGTFERDVKAYSYTEEGMLIPETTGLSTSSRIHDTDLKPGDILKSGSLDLYQTFADLARQAALHPHIPVFRVRIRSRQAFPLACVILLLLTIPIVMNQQSQSLFVGLGVCLLICAGYFILHLFLLDLGNRDRLSPFVAAWAPNVVFGGLGAVFLSKMRT